LRTAAKRRNRRRACHRPVAARDHAVSAAAAVGLDNGSLKVSRKLTTTTKETAAAPISKKAGDKLSWISKQGISSAERRSLLPSRERFWPFRLRSDRAHEIIGKREQEIDADQQQALEPGGLAIRGDRSDDERRTGNREQIERTAEAALSRPPTVLPSRLASCSGAHQLQWTST
jgi:hypothetical protein